MTTNLFYFQYGRGKMVQLADLFSVPEINLLCNVSEYFQQQKLNYHPEILFSDVKVCTLFAKPNLPKAHAWCVCSLQRSIRASHPVMHNIVATNVGDYIESNPNLEAFFQRLRAAGKQMFVVTNSPYAFV